MNNYLEKIFDQLKKLGFGFALGSGIGGLLYLLVNSIYPELKIEPSIFIYSLGALGLGLNQLIDKIVINSILGPISKTISFYTKLGQILLLKKAGLIDDSKAKKILETLINRYFVGKDFLEELNKKVELEELDLDELKEIVKQREKR